LFVFQFLIFVLAMVFFWWVSSLFLLGALVGEIVLVIIGTLPYRYLFRNAEKIRDKYRKKYGELAGQSYWFHYESYTIPLISSSFYCPILLMTYDFPYIHITSMPSHIVTNPLLPIYFALPVGLILMTLGFIIRRASRSSAIDEVHFLYIIYPEKGRLSTGGVYRYIRHPRFLCLLFISIGFGFVANNILAFGVVLIHNLAFYSFIPSEDRELMRRFGDEYAEFKKKIPAIFPKYGNWKNFARFIFVWNEKT